MRSIIAKCSKLSCVCNLIIWKLWNLTAVVNAFRVASSFCAHFKACNFMLAVSYLEKGYAREQFEQDAPDTPDVARLGPSQF